MVKNRIKPMQVGKGVRMSFSKQKEVLEMPNLIEVQKDSYRWFLEEGLDEVFADISPITDYNNHLSLEFVSFQLCEEDKKYLGVADLLKMFEKASGGQNVVNDRMLLS